MPRNARKQSSGPQLIVAIDVGTTFTAASYRLTDSEGGPVRLQEINRWPTQVVGDAKVPSVLYYDNTTPKLYAAETDDHECLIEAEDGHWEKAEWWKLSLRPDHLVLPAGFLPAPIPSGLTVDDIYRDFFGFIRRTVRDFIKKAHGLSDARMEELEASMHVVLTTPNGWEGRHQHRIRMAAIEANLVHHDEGDRILFVTEGEAALHYAIDSKFLNLKAGNNVLVCDAGGGTTDIGTYAISSMQPLNVEEICSPKCYVAGGTFVNEAAKTFITAKVAGTKWCQPGSIEAALRDFERMAKRKFKGIEASVFVKLDGATDSAESKGIIRGRLKIASQTMRSFFDPLIKIVIDGLDECLVSVRPRKIDHVIVVGGFAESDYVYSNLVQWADTRGISIGKPDASLAKAVPHGALSWHMRSSVKVRMAKFHYGAETDTRFISGDPEMHGRQGFTNLLGERRVREVWHPIVRKGTRIPSGEEVTANFYREFGQNEKLTTEIEIFAYRFAEPPTFFNAKNGTLENGFIPIGTVLADLTECFKATPFETSKIGKKFKRLDYDVCLSFERVELKARLRWKEGKYYKYGPAIIAYDI